MRSGIREFQPRQPLDRQLGAGTLNQILRELESLRITRVVNGTFRKLPGGTEITVAPQRGGSAAQATLHPFKISSRVDPESDPDNPSYLVTIRPGTINSLLPTGIFETPNLKEYSLAKDTLRHLILTATSDGEQITSAAVSIESDAADPQTPEPFGLPTTAQFLLGIVYNLSVYQVITDNINVTGKQQFVAEKTSSVGPGELPYEIYYVWG